ncbi:glycoside hydrolase family 43 protein [Galbitalea sp. SE-J8]|uniref:glycoside hydrolase family 43 protein n=1 Tax=Galbitalea sp. SE-J8 TaxID=3054952 RepID=UPI00259CB5EE|nr:glycoside hydrolase family 43 protein [Galbitalea sp. SE-J8]MDM4762141.1 glycoside hydrolase family 43 protein [Galbitalea sp. SE-J8]
MARPVRRGRVVAASVGAAAAIAGGALGGCASGPADPRDATGPSSPADAALAPFAIDEDFPDPDLVRVGDLWWAYATNGPGVNVRAATSADLSEWEVSAVDALPDLPSWASSGKTWAPDVSALPDGRFVMYFTAAATAEGTQCIGVATATDPGGPFLPAGDGPLVCPVDDGGAIDPASFVDADGSRWLLFKNDGNSIGADTWLQLQRVSDDGLALSGDPVRLIRQDQPWEHDLVEAPTLVRHDGRYVLFYSAANYADDSYAMGYATADALTGPYAKADGPFFSTDRSGGRYLGPGGQDVVATDDGDVIAFHSWDELYLYRGMHVAPLRWNDGVPSVATG